MEIQRVFADNMRKYRKAANLTQEQLAEICGFHRTYIGGIEQERINVSMKNIARISQALGVDPAAMFIPREVMTCKPAPEGSSKMLVRPEETDFALCEWTDEGISIRPVVVRNADITIQILSQLIEAGYKGIDLADQYEVVYNEISEFFRTSTTPKKA